MNKIYILCIIIIIIIMKIMLGIIKETHCQIVSKDKETK